MTRKAFRFLILFLLLGSVVVAQNSVDRIIKEFKKSNSSNVLIAAHRGDWRHAPENSLQGIGNCIKMGIDIVEIDVRKTKDGHFVLMHDETIDRTTNGTGKVSELTLSELEQFFLKENQGRSDAKLTDQKIPTLEEALLLAKGKILLNLDKTYGTMKDIYPILQKTGTVDIAIFKGGAAPQKAREDISFMKKSVFFMPIVSDKNENFASDVKEYVKKLHPVAFEILLEESDDVLSESKYMRTHGARVWVNTLWDSLCAGYSDAKAVKDPDANWGHLIEKGVNIIQTDNPQELLQYLKEKGLRKF